MNIPEVALDAASEAIWDMVVLAEEEKETIARAAIEAAIPAIREALAQEVITNGPVLNWELNYDGSEDRTRAAYVEGFRDAVGIVQGETP